jgi:hypothetical protein
MAEYSISMASLNTVLASQFGAAISHDILTLLGANHGAATTANVVTDYAGGGVPVGTDLVYVASSYTSHVGDDLSGASAIILPQSGASTVVMNGGVDRVVTLGGNGGDTLHISGSTNDTIENVGLGSTIDTGAGFDRVVISGAFADYHVATTSDGFVLTSAHGDAITVQNAEFAQFGDGSVVINAATTDEATVANLYNAALDRSVDAPGLDYWWNAAKGSSLLDIADTFLHSSEFTLAHGSVDGLSNSSFIDIMYQSTFGRSGDAAGKAFWQDALDHGISKAQVLLYFAESKEEADLSATKIHITHDILT